MPSYGIASGEVVEIRFNATLANQAVMFTTHYQASAGTPSNTDLANLLAAWNSTIWNGGLDAFVSDDLNGCFVQGQVISPTRKITDELVLTPTEGTNDLPALPPTSAVVVRKRSVTAGRAFRGRIFIPGIPFESTSDGQLNAVVLGNMQTWAPALTEALTFGGRFANPVIFSTKEGVVRNVITEAVVDPILRVQRRREVGRGI